MCSMQKLLPSKAIAVVSLCVALSCSRQSAQTLTLYTSLDSQEAPVYIQAFTEDTGVQVEMVRLSAGEALARLEAEKRNPQVSVWLGGPAPEYRSEEHTSELQSQ